MVARVQIKNQQPYSTKPFILKFKLKLIDRSETKESFVMDATNCRKADDAPKKSFTGRFYFDVHFISSVCTNHRDHKIRQDTDFART